MIMRYLLFIGCAGIAITAFADAREKNTRGIEFALVDKRHMKFRITNHTRRTVELESLYIYMEGLKPQPYTPPWLMWQYLNHGGHWMTIVYSGDWRTWGYDLKPGKSVEFMGPAWELESHVKRGTRVRLQNGDLHSEPFRW